MSVTMAVAALAATSRDDRRVLSQRKSHRIHRPVRATATGPDTCEEWHVTVNGAGRAASADSSRGQAESAELIQLLTPEGERVEHPDYPLDISADELKALYRDLVLVRRIDFEAIALQRQGELGIWASLLGQEAAQIGSGRALEPT